MKDLFLKGTKSKEQGIEPQTKIKAPKLEEIQFYGEYCHIFDYNSLEKLTNLSTEFCVIDYFNNSPLEKISFERCSLIFLLFFVPT